ncbi:hypothetical protein B5X24_HaOG209879 [Helicoverpa armigera]|uniref:Neuroblastoma-amplified sequence n=1 Tax=Helicoverpa armigera TaxID=29058 RepID=A0A2W1BDD6_HELAM|nr:hypothetical protein B5X24_HaOG209879 [Helicoverpa armigera]
MEEKKSILHELYVFSEWKPEPEYIQKSDSILPENISALWRWMNFLGPKKNLIDNVTANWEVLVVTYDGKLRGFLVSQTDGCKLHHSFRFPGGVAALKYCEPHATLYVAGVPRGSAKEPTSSLSAGITAWRILNEEPYYKLSVVSDELEALATDRFKLYVPFRYSNHLAFIVQMELSPDGSKLVCLHCNGDVSVWRLPLLKLVYRWPLNTQPHFDLRNPLAGDEKPGKKDLSVFYPGDINWWSNEEIIVSRFSGAVTICDIETMANILGKKPEFFQGSPKITCAHAGTFMVLECESNVLPAKKSRSDESMEVVKVESDTEDTMLEVAKELIKTILYAITDIETFQPKPRRITVVSRVYRLLGLKSTTPTELFSRKIESGNYSEALALADTFALDSDLVYQQQWRKNPVSTDAIQKYLSKVSKKIWAVHQCVDRLPETLPAAKELLQFGLELTDQTILDEINKEQIDPLMDPEDIALEHLNAYTSELLRCRHVMLFYKERLKLYESILKCEKSTYIKDEYDRLRSNSVVHSAMEIAKEGRIEALTCLWPHVKTVAMQLAVLEKLPETINPLEYQHLLPTRHPFEWFDKRSPVKVPPCLPEEDWCRKEIFRSIWSSNWSEDSTPEIETAGVIPSASDDIVKWYDKRAREIEERSGLVSHALTLVTLATIGGGVEGLDDIMFHLLTLDVLIYDINIEGVTLDQVQKMSILETCTILMKMSTPLTFVSDLKQFVIPFLKRCENLSKRNDACITGLIEYLESISIEDLSSILLVLQSPSEFELDVRTHLELVERCLFAHTGTEQLDKACDLLDTLLKESDGSISGSELVRRVKEVERLVSASSRLAWRGVKVPPRELRELKEEPQSVYNLLTKVSRTLALGEEKPLPQDWEKLLKDILELQSTLFECISKDQCYEIYALALLTSGDAPSIKLASEVLTCTADGRRMSTQVNYPRSVALVSAAAMEYFNSANSLIDPGLELAKCCLTLIKDDNAEIRQELDLINSLQILHSFNVGVVPVQVRICEDRMSLIEACLMLDPNAYLASHKLLKLAALLRIAGDDEIAREGQVLQLAGSYATAWRTGSPASWRLKVGHNVMNVEHDVSNSYYSYDRFALPDAIDGPMTVGQNVLKWFYIQNCLENGVTCELETEVVQKCAEEILYKDTALSVSCLLRSTQEARHTQRLIDTQNTDAAVSCALYATLIKCNAADLRDNAYFTKPAEMARETLEQSNASEEQMEMIRQCIERLTGMGEVDALRAMGYSVNGLLFNADDDYRREIIYRVARSTDKAHVERACSLAEKYNMNALDVWLQHAGVALGSTPPAPPAAPPPQGTAQTHVQHARIKEVLWPQLRGTEHNALINFFALLKSVDEKVPISGLTAAEHIKLLKKAKAASPELDYKLLLEQPSTEDFTAHILNIIKPENVGMVTKFLRTLPPAFKIPLSVNTIYTKWLTKYFFSVPSNATNKKWMQQYRQCASYFNKLSKHELMQFVADTCFTDMAIEREQTWAQVGQELTRWARFLENFHSSTIQTLIDNTNVPRTEIWPEIEKSHGDTEKLISCISRLVMRTDVKLSSLSTLRQCLHVDADLPQVMQSIVEHQLRCIYSSSSMETLVTRLTSYHKEGVKIPEELLEKVMQKATEYALPPHKQIGLLSLSQKSRVHDSDDMMKVAQFTVDLFKNEWSDCQFSKEVTDESLLTEEGRQDAFAKFLDLSDSWQRKKALVDVLNCWPPTRNSDSRSLHSEYLSSLLKNPTDATENLVLIKLLLRRPVLAEEEVKWLANNVRAESVINAIWILLLSKTEHYQDDVLNLVLLHKEYIEKQELEDEFIKELLDNNMFIKLVSSPLYTSIVNYIITKESVGEEAVVNEYCVEWATNELVRSSHISEAGHLQLMFMGVPASLRGFSQTVMNTLRAPVATVARLLQTSAPLGSDKFDHKRIPQEDEGVQGEKVIDLDMKVKQNLFPTLESDNLIFNGTVYKDLPICNIRVSHNNTIFTVTDANGTVKIIRSCGMEGFKNTKKGTNIAAQTTAIGIATRAIDRGVKTVRVRMQGLGPGRLAAVKGLQMGGLDIVSITDNTRVSWNPPRPRKARRL